MRGKCYRKKLEEQWQKGTGKGFLKLIPTSLKFPYIVPLLLKYKQKIIKYNYEWNWKQMFLGNSLGSLVGELKGKGVRSHGVGQKEMEQKCEI